MNFKHKLCALSVGIAAAAAAFAQVTVDDPWIRATVPQQRATGAFMKLTAAEALRLVAASSPAAGAVEIHTMTLDGNIMKMRPVDALELPQGRPVTLAPGGFHVMFLDLRKQIKAGDEVPLTLVFEDRNKKRSSVTVNASARALGQAESPAASHTH